MIARGGPYSDKVDHGVLNGVSGADGGLLEAVSAAVVVLAVGGAVVGIIASFHVDNVCQVFDGDLFVVLVATTEREVVGGVLQVHGLPSGGVAAWHSCGELLLQVVDRGVLDSVHVAHGGVLQRSGCLLHDEHVGA